MAKKRKAAKRASSVPYPQKLSEPLIEAACRVLRKGNFRKIAAAAVDVSAPRFSTWLTRGEQIHDYLADCQEEDVTPEGIDDFDLLCVQLRKSVYDAESEAERLAVACVRRATTGWEQKTTEQVWDEDAEAWVDKSRRIVCQEDWKAAQKFLETRHKERWAPRQDVEVSGHTAKTVFLEEVPKDLTPEAAAKWKQERLELQEKYADGQASPPAQDGQEG